MVYAQRDGLLATDDVSETITDFCAEVVNTLINQFAAPESLEELGSEGVGWRTVSARLGKAHFNARSGRQVERASVEYGPSAPRYSPALLCGQESQAGTQAGSV